MLRCESYGPASCATRTLRGRAVERVVERSQQPFETTHHSIASISDIGLDVRHSRFRDRRLRVFHRVLIRRIGVRSLCRWVGFGAQPGRRLGACHSHRHLAESTQVERVTATEGIPDSRPNASVSLGKRVSSCHEQPQLQGRSNRAGTDRQHPAVRGMAGTVAQPSTGSPARS